MLLLRWDHRSRNPGGTVDLFEYHRGGFAFLVRQIIFNKPKQHDKISLRASLRSIRMKQTKIIPFLGQNVPSNDKTLFPWSQAHDDTFTPIVNRKRRLRVQHEGGEHENVKESCPAFSKSAATKHAQHVKKGGICHPVMSYIESDIFDAYMNGLGNTDLLAETIGKRNKLQTALGKKLSETVKRKKWFEEHADKNSTDYTQLHGQYLEDLDTLSSLQEDSRQWLQAYCDPVNYMTKKLLSIEPRINAINAVSAYDLAPSVYMEDHVRLCLQWTIDGIVNPFLSRPCSVPNCLAQYVPVSDPATNKDLRLPEMVPIETLDAYRNHVGKGESVESWKEVLVATRRGAKPGLVLGVDAWNEPRCLLCTLHNMFSLVMDPTSQYKKVKLADYHAFYNFRFRDILPEYMLETSEVLLGENDVRVPVEVPLIGAMIPALRWTKTGICTDVLYRKQSENPE